MFLNEEITNCTRCGKPFTDFRLQVIMELHTDRLKDTGAWEEVPNLCQTSIEYLCKDCFNTWVDIQTQMNIPYSEDTENIYNIGSNVKGYPGQVVEKYSNKIDSSLQNQPCNKELDQENCPDYEVLEPIIAENVTYEENI